MLDLEGTNGFSETAEGRALLRDLYPIFVGIVPFGARKIATLVADTVPTNQRKEDELTRAALKRWAEQGQGHLWRNVTKSLRVLRRLEREMMAVPEIEEVLNDRSVNIAQMDFAVGVEKFFYGTLLNRVSRSYRDLRLKLNGMDGVYLVGHPEDEFSTIDDDETSKVARFCYYRVVPEQNFLITNIFDLDTTSDRPVFRRASVGFSYIGANGEIYQFLIDRASPEERSIFILEPGGYSISGYDTEDEDTFEDGEYYVSGFLIGAQSFFDYWNLRQNGTFNYEASYHPAAPFFEGLVRNHFSGILWDIPI